MPLNLQHHAVGRGTRFAVLASIVIVVTIIVIYDNYDQLIMG